MSSVFSLHPRRARHISVIGWSGSGKTTFISRAIAECKARGFVCTAVKKSRHAPALAPSGKDSTLYLESGAVGSAYVSGKGSIIYLPFEPAAGPDSSDPVLTAPGRETGAYSTTSMQSPHTADPDPLSAAMLLPPADLVFFEGAEPEGAIRILVAGPAQSPLKRELSSIDILVTRDENLAARALNMRVTVIDPDRVDMFVHWLEEKLAMENRNNTEGNASVSIFCDGKELPLVPFVAELFARTLSAMTGTLKGGENAREITITLRKK